MLRIEDMVDRQHLYFQTLPREILYQISSFLDVSELRNLRLTCKHAQDIPNQSLFQTFYLYPHRRSFEALLALAHNENLRRHVQRVVYDGRWFDAHHQVYRALRSGTRQPEAEVPGVEEDYDNGALEAALVDTISEALPKLPSLNTIELFDVHHPFSPRIDEVFEYRQLPEYYRRWLRGVCLMPSPPEGTVFVPTEIENAPSTVSCFFDGVRRSRSSVSKVVLTAFSATDLLKGTTIEDIPAHFGCLLSGLRNLRIDFGCIPLRKERAALARLPIVLTQCSNLLYLSLEFGALGRAFANFHSISPYADTSLMDDLFPDVEREQRRLLPTRRLRVLDLRGFRCSGAELEALLEQADESPAFLALSIWDLTLLPEDGAMGNRSCFVRLIKYLRNMGLWDVKLLGHLHNYGNQNWEVDLPYPRDGNSLAEKVHRYMQSEREFEVEDCECPLSFVAVPAGEYDISPPTEDTEENNKWSGDASWTMLRRSRSAAVGRIPDANLMAYMAVG